MAKKVHIRIRSTARPTGNGIRVTTTVNANGKSRTITKTYR